MSYIGASADSSQFVRCTSNPAPINNMRVVARLCFSSSYGVISSSGWVYNGSIYSRNQWLSTTTPVYTYNKTVGVSSVYGAGLSGCWRVSLNGYYDVLTGKANNANLTTSSFGLGTKRLGNIHEADAGFDVELVSAVATNGEQGYVYYEDLQEAEGQGVSTPEEAALYMERKIAASTAAIQSALNKRLSAQPIAGCTQVTADEAKAILEAYYSAIENGGSLNDSSVVPGIRSSHLAGTTSLGGAIGEEMLEDSLREAQEAVLTYVPVYDEDGETVVGQLPVGCL